MPRLQVARRTSLLSTNLRNVFLEAFGRNVIAAKSKPYSKALVDAADLNVVARRIQTEIRQVTGRYYPLYQVVRSIHGLGYQSDERTMRPPTRSVPIVITPPTLVPPDILHVEASMSRRRIARNIPALQCQLPIPPPALTWSSTPAFGFSCGLTPTYSLSPSIHSMRALSGNDTRSPVTPIDQIVHTPLTPPKLPRVMPPPPRTWVRLNMDARRGEVSPLSSPTLPLSPYLLGSAYPGKPLLGRLRIPETVPVGEAQPYGSFLTPSPQALSPFDLGGSASSTLENHASRLAPPRANLASSLTRTALLRSSRPGLARTSSLNTSERSASPSSPLASHAPVSPFASQPLASPLIIHSEVMDGGYFRI